MNKVERRYDIDWLRTIGVLLVIPFHSLLIFNMNPQSIMYVKDSINVRLFNLLSGIIDRFHMSLLFMLAGMAVYFSLQSRTVNKFICERVKKLLVPAAFGCIVLNPIMTYICLISRHKKVTFEEHLIDFFTKPPEDLTGINGAFTPAHLWFIIFLFIFSLLGVPLFMSIIKHNSSRLLYSLGSFFEKPFMLILTVIPITIISAVNILGDKNPLVYFGVFFMGFIFAVDERYQRAINRDTWGYLAISIIIVCMKFTLPGDFKPWSGIWIIYGFFDRASRLIPVFALIGLGSKFMNKKTRALAYLSKAAFPIYVIHMLVNTTVGFFVIKLTISPYIKYILIVTITFSICFLIYEGIRRVKLLRLIFAVKTDKKLLTTN